jgi:hypothetical protein
MLNRIESFSEAGTKAARAMWQGDAATATHWMRHHRAMLRHELPEDRPAAEEAYKSAYAAESKRIRGASFVVF